MTSYTNGIPDDQRILNLARQYREQYCNDELLYNFYDQVVRFEETDAEQHRKLFLAQKEGKNRFV
jgi:hypothetical protein